MKNGATAAYTALASRSRELDRAQDEGRKALAIAKATKSAAAARELKQLGTVLSAA